LFRVRRNRALSKLQAQGKQNEDKQDEL